MCPNCPLTCTYQLAALGNIPYDPATQKNVPKYFTGKEALEIWMPKPMKHIAWPVRTNGKRHFILSEKRESIAPTETRLRRYVSNIYVDGYDILLQAKTYGGTLSSWLIPGVKPKLPSGHQY